MSQEAALAAAQLQRLQRERDAALADTSFAREEARQASAAQERALAAARAAQQQLQAERDAVMASLGELQVAFNAADGKRTAEIQRLRGVAEARQREVAALRAQLAERSAQLQALSQAASAAVLLAQGGAAAAEPGAAGGQPAAQVQVQPGAPGAARPQPQPQHRKTADMDADMVLLQSVDSQRRSLAASSTAGGAAQLLQPLRARNTAGAPAAGAAAPKPLQQQQQGQEQVAEGWGEGYLSKYEVRLLNSCHAGGCGIAVHCGNKHVGSVLTRLPLALPAGGAAEEPRQAWRPAQPAFFGDPRREQEGAEPHAVHALAMIRANCTFILDRVRWM